MWPYSKDWLIEYCPPAVWQIYCRIKLLHKTLDTITMYKYSIFKTSQTIPTGGVWKPSDISCVFPACSILGHNHHCFQSRDATHQMTGTSQDLNDLLKSRKRSRFLSVCSLRTARHQVLKTFYFLSDTKARKINVFLWAYTFELQKKICVPSLTPSSWLNWKVTDGASFFKWIQEINSSAS